MRPLFDAYMACLEGIHSAIVEAMKGLPQEALDWEPGKEMNSVCVLVAHTAGSERYLVGDVALGQPTGRDRPAEFGAQGLSADALAARLAESAAFVRGALERLSVEDWEATRVPRDGQQRTVAWALLHLLDHAAQHSGHIQLTRQIWEQRHK